jgi:16S rRNA (uracil1498-N3)-methyltransferase
MNLVLLFERDFTEEKRSVRIDDRRRTHIMGVHRAAVGDELRVGELGGLIGTGKIISIQNEAIEMEVSLDMSPPRPLPVTLILALPRPKFLRRILFTASGMGVKKIYIINSHRVEKSYWQTPFLGKEQIEKQLVLGLEQACDTIMPSVFLRPLFKPFVEDELPVIVQGAMPILADPHAERPWPQEISGPVVLAVGPEGGFIPYETGKLVSAGFRKVSLGDRILHVESAVPALLSRFL